MQQIVLPLTNKPEQHVQRRKNCVHVGWWRPRTTAAAGDGPVHSRIYSMRRKNTPRNAPKILHQWEHVLENNAPSIGEKNGAFKIILHFGASYSRSSIADDHVGSLTVVGIHPNTHPK